MPSSGNSTFSGCVITASPSRPRAAALSARTPSSRGWRSLPCTVHSMKATCDDDLGPHPVRAGPRQPDGLRERRLAISSASSRARSSSSSFVSKPVPTLPGEDEVVAARSSRRAARRGRPAPPCGSVKPPTTSSCVASHFILSQCGERRCSYGESRRFAMTPSQPSRQARSHGCGSSSASTRSSGASKGQAAQQRAALVERQRRHVAAVEPEDVEHVVGGLTLRAPHAGRLAVEDRRRCTGRPAIASATAG